MTGAYVWYVAALAAVSAMTPNGGDDAVSAVAGARGQVAGTFVVGTFASDAGTRRWKLWVPAGYDAKQRLPMVVLLHGCTQDADDIARGTRVTEHADEKGLLVLIPQQPESANPKKCWNWYDPAHQRRDAGEPSLVAGMTRQVMREWPVDSQRVYVAGISAGAAMASIVAIAYPDVYASVALHSGIPYRVASTAVEGVTAMSAGSKDPQQLGRLAFDDMGARARPIPAIIVQGAADPVVKPVNAEHTREMWLTMNRLARGDAVSTSSSERVSSQTTSRQGELDFVKECFGPAAATGECSVVTVTVRGLGHAWSGGSKLGTFTDERGPDATREILEFLLAQRMPVAGGPNVRRP